MGKNGTTQIEIITDDCQEAICDYCERWILGCKHSTQTFLCEGSYCEEATEGFVDDGYYEYFMRPQMIKDLDKPKHFKLWE